MRLSLTRPPRAGPPAGARAAFTAATVRRGRGPAPPRFRAADSVDDEDGGETVLVQIKTQVKVGGGSM
jgi:hypothetical protein